MKNHYVIWSSFLNNESSLYSSSIFQPFHYQLKDQSVNTAKRWKIQVSGAYLALLSQQQAD